MIIATIAVIRKLKRPKAVNVQFVVAILVNVVRKKQKRLMRKKKLKKNNLVLNKSKIPGESQGFLILSNK